MNILFIMLLSFIDAFLYAFCNEKMLKGNKNSVGFLDNRLSQLFFYIFKIPLKLLFKEYSYKGKPLYPFYRIFQGALDLLCLWYLWNQSIWQLAGFCIAWYLMSKEYLYYIIAGQIHLTREYEYTKADVYWLKRIYFSGWWLFRRGYNYGLFRYSAIIGFIALIISNLIPA